MNYAKIELHLHLDGSLNIGWAYKKAIRKKIIKEDTTFEDFYDLLFAKNVEHSALSITKFDLLCDLLQNYDDLFEATYDLCKRLSEIGIIYAEIRFASQQHCKEGLSQREAIKAVIDGAKKARDDFPIYVGIINCLMHKGDSSLFNEKDNYGAIEAGESFYGDGLVGFDLAGYENNCPYSDYSPYFKLIKEKGMAFTLHCGEMGIGSHILDALKMKPDRIGHGINCIQDESYIKALKEAQIPLEVCVTSNIKTTMNYGSHPIRRMIKEGLKVTINTDNMIFARSDLHNEFQQLKTLGIEDETLKTCMYNALDAAFCDEETKEIIRKQLP